MTHHQYTTEEIAAKLEFGRSLEADGVATRQICERLDVAELTYLRWCRKFGSLDADAASRLVGLEKENARLRSAVERMEEVLGTLRSLAERDATPETWSRPRAV